MKDIFIQAIFPLLATIISGIASWLLLEARKYIRSKTKNELVNSAMEQISHTTESIVAELSQTMVNNMKDAAPDGKLTKNEAQVIKLHALNAVRRQLPIVIKDAAKLGVTDLGEFIMSKIEQAVLKQKAIVPITSTLLTGDNPKEDQTNQIDQIKTADDISPRIMDKHGYVIQDAVDKHMIEQSFIDDLAKRLFDLVHQSKPEIISAGQ